MLKIGLVVADGAFSFKLSDRFFEMKENTDSSFMVDVPQAYGGLETYQDVGETISTFEIGTPYEYKTKFSFRTIFKRPGSFLFECREDEKSLKPEYQLISDGLAIYEVASTETTILPVVAFARNGSQIVSIGLAPPVLQFLMKGVGGTTLTRLQGIYKAGVSKLSDNLCSLFCSTIVDQISPREVNLWIAEHDCLIRKTQETFTVDNARLDVWRSLNEIIPGNFEELVEQKRLQNRRAIEKYFSRTSNLDTLKRNHLERSLKPKSVVQISSYLHVATNEELPDDLFRCPS